MAPEDTIARVCAQLTDDLDPLVERVVARIRIVVPAYEVVAYQDQFDYIRSEFVIMLDCLARGVPLPADLVEKTRELGKRRAQQGMTLQDVIQSYHLGLREIWTALVDQGGGAGPALLDASSYLWDNMHVLTSAVAVGHGEATRSAQAVRVGLRYRLLEAINRWPLAAPSDLEGLATSLGYDLEGSFTAVVAPADGWNELDVESFQSALERTLRNAARQLDVIHCSRVGDFVVGLTQRRWIAPAPESMHARVAATPMGVGMTRPGLVGAAASIQDARLAVRTAGPGEVVNFEDVWPTALLTAHPEQSAPLLAGGADTTRNHVHLAEAVKAYADNGFSISAAARALHLHANSVTYRLERWQELTGWNPRTFNGLLRSMATLRLAELPVVAPPEQEPSA